MGIIRDTVAAGLRRFADTFGKPSFAGTPFPDGGVEKRSQLVDELGGTGTFNFGGFIRGEDPNPEMDAQTAITNFDLMRRSDSQVHAALEVVKQPIRTADYELDPSDPDDPRAAEIAEFVRWNLFEGMVTTWDDCVRQSLLMLDFGFMLFEKVWEVSEEGPHAGRIILHKMAPRPPKTLWQWFTDTDGALLSVKQLAVKSGTYQFLDIPASKLVRFTFQQEGDNFTGISMLRSAYPHWLIKKQLYLIDAIRATRFGVGIPRAKLLPGYSPTTEDKAALVQMLQGLSSHQHAYLIEPPQVTVDILMPQGVQGGAQLMPSIEHHNQQITRNILAQFLDMGGKSSGGSRALGASAMDFFLNAIESIADQFCDVMNKQVIKDLVDMNFEGGLYPTLRPVGIQDSDVKSLATAAQALAACGLLTPDKKTENTFRNLMNLPEIAEDGDTADPTTGMIDPTTGKPMPPTPGQPPAPTGPQAVAQGAPPTKPAKTTVTAPAAAKTTVAAPVAAKTTVTAPQAAATRVTAPTSATSTVPGPTAAATTVREESDAVRTANAPPLTNNIVADLPDPQTVSTNSNAEAATPPEGVSGRPADTTVTETQPAATTHDPRQPVTAATTVSTATPARTTVYETSPATSTGASAVPATSNVRAPQAAVSTISKVVPANAHMARSTTVASSGGADEEGHSSSGKTAHPASPPHVAVSRRPPGTAVPATTATRMSTTTPDARALASKKQPRDTTFWRDPTTLEQRVLDLREIPRRLDTARSALLVTLQSVRAEQISRIAQAVAHASGGEKPKAPLVGKMQAEILKVMRGMFEYGREQVIEELRRQGARTRRFSDEWEGMPAADVVRALAAPKSEAKAQQHLVMSAQLSAQSASDKLIGSAMNEALRLKRAGWEADEIEDALMISMGELSDGDLSRLSAMEVNEGFSLGRVSAGEDFKDQIEYAEYSAILDMSTCPVCEALDGQQFEVDSDEYDENMPPNPNCDGGDACRCVYIYVMITPGDDAGLRDRTQWDDGAKALYDGQPREGGRFAAGKMSPNMADFKPGRPLTGPQSKGISEVVAGGAVVDYNKVPGLSTLHSAMGVKDNSKMTPAYNDARKAVFEAQRVEHVPFSNLTYTQDRVNMPHIFEMAKVPSVLDKSVFVIRSGGKNYVMNGHHRVIANYVAGKSDIQAHVFDTDVQKHAEHALGDFDEDKHPRGEHGRFTNSGGSEKETAPKSDTRMLAIPPSLHAHIAECQQKSLPLAKGEVLAKLPISEVAKIHGVLAEGQAALPEFQALMSGIGASLGIKDGSLAELADHPGHSLVAVGPIKSAERIAEKAVTEKGGDLKGVRDIVRGTIVVKTVPEAQKVLEAFREKANVVDLKDRFSNPTGEGYRDIMFRTVLSNGMPAEVQIHAAAMLHVKNDVGHKFYEALRTLSPSSPEAKSYRDQSQAAYGKAWEGVGK